jgi:bifunctional enzyme CysN/CysC
VNQLKIVIVGHVDHGKSTLIGRLLVDTGSIAPDRVEKARLVCERQGKPFEWAFLLDALEEERLQGITIDTTQIAFRTPRREFLIIDAPGHKEFLKNMVSGAAQADAAVLIVDAEEGLREQTRRHASLLGLLGLREVVVAINKMDRVDYGRARFEALRAEVTALLRGFNVEPRGVVPVAAREGVNVVERSARTGWYEGPSLLGLLEALQRPVDTDEAPLRLLVQDVYKFDDRRIIAGRVESGILRVGARIRVYPTREVATVRTIERWPGPPAAPGTGGEAGPGLAVAFTLEESLFVDRGQVIGDAEDLAHAPTVGREIKANIFWLGREPLRPGRRYRLRIGPQESAAEVLRLERVLDSSSLAERERAEGPLEVRATEVAEVVFRAERDVAFDAFRVARSTGRFVVMDGMQVAGGGIILDHVGATLGAAASTTPAAPAERRASPRLEELPSLRLEELPSLRLKELPSLRLEDLRGEVEALLRARGFRGEIMLVSLPAED